MRYQVRQVLNKARVRKNAMVRSCPEPQLASSLPWAEAWQCTALAAGLRASPEAGGISMKSGNPNLEKPPHPSGSGVHRN